MLVVKVELHSAVTGEVTEIARSVIYNTGEGSATRGHYKCFSLRGRDEPVHYDRGQPPNGFDVGMMRVIREKAEGPMQQSGEVNNYPRKDLHVWNLVARALSVMGYK